MELVALLSAGKGTWGQVAGIINRGQWEKVFLVCPEFMTSRVKTFDFTKNSELISVNFDRPIKEVVENLKEKFKGKFSGMEVGLSIASGEGKEHMALISALINLPVGIKFIVLTKDGILEL